MNAVELRALTSKVIDLLLDGTLTPAKANAITRAVGKRLAVLGAQMKAAKLANRIR